MSCEALLLRSLHSVYTSETRLFAQNMCSKHQAEQNNILSFIYACTIYVYFYTPGAAASCSFALGSAAPYIHITRPEKMWFSTPSNWTGWLTGAKKHKCFPERMSLWFSSANRYRELPCIWYQLHTFNKANVKLSVSPQKMHQIHRKSRCLSIKLCVSAVLR